MGFPTPDAVALDGFGGHAHVVLTGVDGPCAGVLLLTHGWGGYPYLVVCRQTPDGWVAASDGNASHSWTSTDDERDVGVLACWGEAPYDAAGVQVRWQRQMFRAPAREGFWLWVKGGVADDAAGDYVEIVAIEREANP